jgi:hypothetical protein
MVSTVTQADLFEYAAHTDANVPAFIRPHLDAQGKAFGDPLEDWIEFQDWLHTPAGGEIANAFIRHAHQIRKSGWAAYSAQGIIEAIRWTYHLEKGPDAAGGRTFKISHNWRRRLAIWAMIRDKDLKDFFRVQNREEPGGQG